MPVLLLSSLLIYISGLFNLLGINQSFMFPQLFFGLIALLIFFIIKSIGIEFFRTNSSFFYWVFVILLFLTFIIGIEVKGSKRWIDLYFFSFQSSEFLKIFFIILLSKIISSSKNKTSSLHIYLKSFFYFFIPFFIIFKQPDLASSIVYVVIFFTIILFSDIPKKYLFYTLIIFFLTLPIGWLILKDYQKARIESFLNPHLNQSGASYNMTQALITVGSGKLLGRGLGFGTQSKLLFLPENQTDFAFSSFIEQFGFAGGFAVLVLYSVILGVLIKKMIALYYDRTEKGRFNFLLTAGFFSFFISQFFINIGMNLGLFPIAGITLPLISYGGSSLVTWFIGLAILP